LKKPSGKIFEKFKGNTRTRQQTKWINADEGNSIPDHDEKDLNVFTIGENSSRPIVVDIKVNGKPLTMEVDTGAAVTVISDKTRK
jgi:predicted aspartyl protease